MENSSDDNSPEKNQKKKNKYVTINNAHVKIDLESKRNSILKLSHYSTMTKAEIVGYISKETGIDKTTALTVVESFMEQVKGALANDENVYLRGFGSFILKKRAQKTARNITQNTTMIIPEHNIPAFKPAKVFFEAVQ